MEKKDLKKIKEHVVELLDYVGQLEMESYYEATDALVLVANLFGIDEEELFN